MKTKTSQTNSQITTGTKVCKHKKKGTDLSEIKKSWTIYKDPYFSEDVILLGYKEKSILEEGYYWCPFIR